MTSTGSASNRHSHIDHKDGRIVERAFKGEQGGSEAKIFLQYELIR